jgi:hypothetical protein
MDCPHCGGIIDANGGAKPLPHPVFDDVLRCIVVDSIRRDLTNAEWRLLTAMRQRFERLVPIDFLCRVTAKDAADGGSPNTVRVRICHLRKKLRETPFGIASGYAEGYGLFWAKDVVTTGNRSFKVSPRISAATLPSSIAAFRDEDDSGWRGTDSNVLNDARFRPRGHRAQG